MMKTKLLVLLALLLTATASRAQQRRPVDAQHPLWLVHVDVWNVADPQKIIDLIPDDVKPYVCMNLSLSCQYDTQRNMYRMPRCAVRTYKSWATVCQQNGLWFTCQPASGGHTHIQDDDMVTFEYFFKRYPNFLGWNYAEQFWGFDESGDKSSSSQASRIALFARLVKMSHDYGGFLTVSFCGNVWSHPLNPLGMLKRNKQLMEACQAYPEAILWLYKYTTSSCFYNNESVTMGPFVSGLANNYGVRYDNCGWNGALDALLGEGHGKKYPVAAGIGTVMEQTGMNGGAVWDGPELIWTEDFRNLGSTQDNGYQRRNWGTFPGFDNAWVDMFRKIIDGTLYIPTRQEVVGKTKVVIVNDVNSGSDEDRYATWGDLYDGLYKQNDPFNRGNGQWMDNFCYFKKTGRYGAIPMVTGLYDEAAQAIPMQVRKSQRNARWSSVSKKTADFDEQYPEVSKGDLFVERFKNQLVTYTPYSYMNSKKTATADIPLQYNTCDTLTLTYGKLSSGVVREYEDHIDFYLNNYRSDTTSTVSDRIVIKGATAEPTFTTKKRAQASVTTRKSWNAETGTLTLYVNHNGPVDIIVRCAGTATDRRTDVAGSEALGEPQKPADYYGPVIIEAEDMDTKNVQQVATTNSGWFAPDMEEFAGNGYVVMGTNRNGSLRHQLSTGHAGTYDVMVRYLCTTKAGQLTLRVNGTTSTMATEQTTGKEWKKASVKAILKEGVNELYIDNTEGLPVTIDQVTYIPEGTPAEQFLVTVRDADHGQVQADVAEAVEGQIVTLTITPDEGYALTELRVVNSVYYSMAKTIDVQQNEGTVTFTMPDDNVTLQPVFTDMTSVYQLDFSTSSSSLPEGWRCVQENNEVHEYPNNYGQGARTMAGFTGYSGKALYWRNSMAEYGRQTAYPLMLGAGDYKLTFAMAAWKESPLYKVQVMSTSGQTVATSKTYTATPCAYGSTSADLSATPLNEFTFTVTQPGNYVIRMSDATGTGGYHEFLLLACQVNTAGGHSGLRTPMAGTAAPAAVFNLQGVRLTSPTHGLNFVRTPDGRTRKVIRF